MDRGEREVGESERRSFGRDLAAVIKSAASAKPQGSSAAPVVRLLSHRPWMSVGSPGIPGGCASSRVDHGCKIPPGEAALAADFCSVVMDSANDDVILHVTLRTSKPLMPVASHGAPLSK